MDAMTDIISELRDVEDDTYEGTGSPTLCGEAADEIEHLAIEVSELKELLEAERRVVAYRGIRIDQQIAEGARKDTVIHAAAYLRDHCINNAGTPPALLVCNLDDALSAVSGSPLRDVASQRVGDHVDLHRRATADSRQLPEATNEDGWHGQLLEFADGVSDTIWGGESGWYESGLPALLKEMRKRLRRADKTPREGGYQPINDGQEMMPPGDE